MDVGSSSVEKMGVKVKKIFCLLAALFLIIGCSSKKLKFDKEAELEENKEFEQKVKIVDPAVPVAAGTDSVPTAPATSTAAPAVPGTPAAPGAAGKNKKTTKVKTVRSKKDAKIVVVDPAVAAASQRRQPELESDVGFVGRRPVKDPFKVGEKIVHSVNYFKMEAGTLTLETRPFVEVNGRKNYQFRTSIKTTSIFQSFYTVDDFVDVLMDFEQMIPSVFTLHVKESTQLKEAQMFFDHQKLQATYWEKKVTDKSGVENKKLQWEIMPYAQNVFSAAFYLRSFQWEVGKENAFAVADDEKNLIFRAKAIRRERISTAAGEFDAIVIRPEFELKGKFNPIGDNFIWLSDDDRKYILRIESKIKIGTLVSEVVEIHPGH
jgi:hypothetical protein